MLRNIITNIFSPEDHDGLTDMFRNEYKREYRHLRRERTPLTHSLVKNFLISQRG